MLSTREVAPHLNVSEQTIRTVAKHGSIPSILVGRQRRFDQDKVEATLEGNADTAPDPDHWNDVLKVKRWRNG